VAEAAGTEAAAEQEAGVGSVHQTAVFLRAVAAVETYDVCCDCDYWDVAVAAAAAAVEGKIAGGVVGRVGVPSEADTGLAVPAEV